jgi:hypothetical protein
LSLDTVSTKRDAHVATRSLQTNHEKLKIDKDYDRIFFPIRTIHILLG